MKFVYCIHSVGNPGGMERVLLNKVRWLVKHGHDVVIATTDQKDRPPFYPFPHEVKFVDFNVNYSDDNSLPVHRKIIGFLRRRRIHRKKLSKLLMAERPDFTITLYPCESSFIPDINDGSKKILEFHYSKNFRIQYSRSGILGLLDRWRTRADERLMRNFDQFVVLTTQDAADWKGYNNLSVIPNAAMHLSDQFSCCSEKRVIAVGRLDYQKGFDRLIETWDYLMKQHPELGDWHLDIFGQGEWKEMLQDMISSRNLSQSVRINSPVNDIASQYYRSSMLVMSSNYEGFPMVMIEAMGMGLPVVSFDFKCGPRDIIEDGKNGYLVKNGDIDGLARSMARLMKDDELRKKMGVEARKVTETFSEEAVMARWMKLFNEITTKK